MIKSPRDLKGLSLDTLESALLEVRTQSYAQGYKIGLEKGYLDALEEYHTRNSPLTIKAVYSRRQLVGSSQRAHDESVTVVGGMEGHHIQALNRAMQGEHREAARLHLLAHNWHKGASEPNPLYEDDIHLDFGRNHNLDAARAHLRAHKIHAAQTENFESGTSLKNRDAIRESPEHPSNRAHTLTEAIPQTNRSRHLNLAMYHSTDARNYARNNDTTMAYSYHTAAARNLDTHAEQERTPEEHRILARQAASAHREAAEMHRISSRSLMRQTEREQEQRGILVNNNTVVTKGLRRSARANALSSVASRHSRIAMHVDDTRSHDEARLSHTEAMQLHSDAGQHSPEHKRFEHSIREMYHAQMIDAHQDRLEGIRPRPNAIPAGWGGIDDNRTHEGFRNRVRQIRTDTRHALQEHYQNKDRRSVADRAEDASRIANNATQFAKESNITQNHENARRTHNEAARLHSIASTRRVGEQKEYHLQKRDEHAKQVGYHHQEIQNLVSNTKGILLDDDAIQIKGVICQHIFKTPTGRYRFLVSNHPADPDHHVVSFFNMDKKTHKQTGDARQGAVRVMRVIGEHTSKFISEHKPKTFSFSSDKNEESRVKLYDKVATVLAAHHGYHLKREEKSYDMGTDERGIALPPEEEINYHFTRKH